VLNTHFLNLILKLMKNGATYSGATASSRATGSSSVGGSHTSLVTTMNANIHQARLIAATVLAFMLRYATVLEPPSIRARDDHIVATIVGLLKSNVKMDVRFKRRAMAALGETVFYITAQEDELPAVPGAAVPDRWVLPYQAVECLINSLNDENDEITKHYAVKVRLNNFFNPVYQFKFRQYKCLNGYYCVRAFLK
jgi:hypothetical protein